MLRGQGERAEGFLRPQGRPRDAQGVRGASWVQGEQAGSKGSELRARVSLAPTEVVGTTKHSITYPLFSLAPLPPLDPLGVRGVNLAPTEMVGTSKHSIQVGSG